MASNEAFSNFLTQASTHFNNVRPMLPMYTHLILSALFPIYTGAHASLSRPSSAAKPDKKAKTTDDEDDEEDKVQKMEGLSNSDAIVLPITAGITLAGLYFLIMKYGADLINLIMGYYFAGVGVYSVGQLLSDAANILVSFAFPTYYRYKGSVYKASAKDRKAIRQDSNDKADETIDLPMPNRSPVPLPQRLINFMWDLRTSLKQRYRFKAYVHTVVDLSMKVTIINFISSLAGVGTVLYVNTVSKPWFLTNLQGFAVSYSALQLLSPTTFATGSLILSALFFYDIWAVFFTPLMVTVAKNLDQPIKLVFPRPDQPSETPGEPPVKSFSMLGLGDIVVPGIMIGLALRFDLYMFYLREQKRSAESALKADASEKESEPVVVKAPYVPVTGHWGDWFWTLGLSKDSLPDRLKTAFPKPYFTASIAGYISGMLTTLGVMSVFHHAQPALLYLVPGVLISLWGTALARGELNEMWSFTEALNAEQLEESSDGEKKTEGEEKSPKGLFERLWSEIWAGDKKEEATKVLEADSSGQSSKSKDATKEKATSEKDNAVEDGLLFSLSISRYEPSVSGKAKAKADEAVGEATTEQKRSLTTPEGSDEPVVITSADLAGAQDAGDASCVRTRSMRTTSSGKR